jgi:hypothetical protein
MVLHPFAKDFLGNLVEISYAQKGVKYYCFVCDKPMSLRISPEHKKCTHFAHFPGTHQCSLESALHSAFKNELYNRFSKAIQDGAEVLISWNCRYCRKTHTVNLLRLAERVDIEKNIENTRPDITLYKSQNRILSVIEIIVKHFLEQKTMEYYIDRDIPLIEFELLTEIDISRAYENPLKPDRLNACIDIKCQDCGASKKKAFLYIIESLCPACNGIMKISVLGTATNDKWYGPKYFAFDEIKFINKYGINVRNHGNVPNVYWCHFCCNCGYSEPEFRLCYYVAMAKRGFLNRERIEMGYFCPICRIK